MNQSQILMATLCYNKRLQVKKLQKVVKFVCPHAVFFQAWSQMLLNYRGL